MVGQSVSVVVTDMRVDYGPLIAQVFPKATHQECIFHALQEVQKQLKEIYGSDYAETHPDVEMLREEIEQIFLRHSAATWSRAGGARLDAIAGMLGHANTTTTSIYAQIVDRMSENPALYLEAMMGA